MELVTRENKIQFEKWLPNYNIDIKNNSVNGIQGINPYFPIYFNQLPFKMQIGVYLAYYDSLDKAFRIQVRFTKGYWIYTVGIEEQKVAGFYESRNEAYKEAFKKADEIINNQ